MIILESSGLKINNETVDFVITQPSSPITKNKKTGETLDLGAHPNASIECELSNALIVTNTYSCEFEYDGHQYNFDAKVINQVHNSSDKYNVSLQAIGKVVVGGKSTAPTISYDTTTFTVSASGDGEVKMYVDGVETVSPHTFTQGETDVTYVVTATAEQDGKAISDTVTENCLVPAEPDEQVYFSLNAGSTIDSSNGNFILGYDDSNSMFYAGNGDKGISVSDDNKIVWAADSSGKRGKFLMSFGAPEYITKIELLDFECASGGNIYTNNATYDSETRVLTIKDSAINAIKYELRNYSDGVAGNIYGFTVNRIQIWTGGTSGTQSISFSEIRIYYDASHSWDSWNIPELVTMYDNGYFYWTGTTCSIVDENNNNVTNTIVTGTVESATFQKDGHTYSGMKASVDTTKTGDYNGYAMYYPFYSQDDYYSCAVGYGYSFTI